MITIKEHENKKKVLQEEFLKLKKTGKIAINKKTSNLFRQRKKIKKQRINVRHFNKVISIDKKNLVAEVEGMIPYDDLVKETLKHGLMPTVVPQLKMITIGGAISGIGIEASSFKYGLVHETVLEMEILLGDGSIITCTPENKYKDLFFHIPDSYGTLGYILKLKVRLVPVKRYVRLKHEKFEDPERYFKRLKKLCLEKRYDFIDGTIFDEKEMYITKGRFTEGPGKPSNYRYMKPYYKSIRKKKEDLLKVKDFIWRWDADWFWCSKEFGMQNMALRLLLGKFMLNSRAYLALKKYNERFQITNKIGNIKKKVTGKKNLKEAVIQDVGIPIENCKRFVDFFHKKIGIKPIWVCPMKPVDKRIYPLFNLKPGKLYVDFGFWDFVPSEKHSGFYNKLIEDKVEKLKGKKSLYSTSYFSEKDFDKFYEGRSYKRVKKKYDSKKAFLDLYEKTVLGK